MSNTNGFTVRGTIIWLLCAIFFLYEFLLRTVLGTFQQPIVHDLHLSKVQFSLLSSTMYLVIYGVMQIPAGLVINRYGLKNSLTFAVLICSVSVLGFSYTHDYHSALIFRMLTGFGSAFGFIGMLVAVFEWMPKSRVALMIGVSQFVGTMGPMLAAGPINALSESSGSSWRLVFFVLSCFGLFLATLMYFVVKNKQDTIGQYLVLNRPSKPAGSVKRLFSSSQPWLIAVCCGALYFLIEYLSENEGHTYIMLKGHSTGFASYMITLSWLGYALGCPSLGYLSDYFERRKLFILMASIGLILAFGGIIVFSGKYALITFFMLLGVGASGISIGFANIAEHFSASYRTIGLSFNNGMITIFSAINSPLIALGLDHAGGAATLATYNNAFFVVLIGLAAILLVTNTLIRESFCKSAVSHTVLTVPSHD